jgi:hypothetical protein
MTVRRGVAARDQRSNELIQANKSAIRDTCNIRETAMMVVRKQQIGSGCIACTEGNTTPPSGKRSTP